MYIVTGSRVRSHHVKYRVSSDVSSLTRMPNDLASRPDLKLPYVVKICPKNSFYVERTLYCRDIRGVERCTHCCLAVTIAHLRACAYSDNASAHMSRPCLHCIMYPSRRRSVGSHTEVRASISDS